MKHLTNRTAMWVAAAALTLSQPAFAALQPGDAAPAFTTQASLAGKAHAYALADALKRGPVVVYFYPAAFTSGCSIQAHYFAVHHAQFVAAGASIVGVSFDDIARLNAFSADPETCAGKFPVASDAGGKIARAYSLKVHDSGMSERTTFIVGTDGKVIATIGGVDPVENVQRALDAVRKLGAKR